MPILDYIAVGVGGSVGAIARYTTSGLVQRLAGDGAPLGTLAVNVIGCLMIGALSAVAEGATGLSEQTRLVVVVGLLGSFTTFSTFGNETFELVRDGRYRAATLYVFASVLLGLGAVLIGRLAARSIGA